LQLWKNVLQLCPEAQSALLLHVVLQAVLLAHA
jgi:hypothetical protein